MTHRMKRGVTALTAAGTLAVGLTVAVSAAGADTVPVGASGNTTVQLNSQVLKALQTNGCGVLIPAATGNAKIAGTGAGKANATFPITGLVTNPNNGKIRIVHAGSGVELSNACYDIRFTNLYIQNFGAGDQIQTLDVLAKVKAADGTDRELVFTLDLSSAKPTIKDNGTVKIRSLDLLLSQEGANQFNRLATGNAPDEAGNVAGPFHAGEQAGKARTSIRMVMGEQPSA